MKNLKKIFITFATILVLIGLSSTAMASVSGPGYFIGGQVGTNINMGM